MKKMISVLLALAMIITLCACHKSNDSQETSLNESKPDVITETETTESITAKSIELTLENWDQYFEFRPYIRTEENSFGEFQCVDRCRDGFALKEEYVGRLAQSLDIAVEVDFGPAVVYRVEYNIATQKLTTYNQDEIIIESADSNAIWFFGSGTFHFSGYNEDFNVSSCDVIGFGNMSSPDEGYFEEYGINGRLNGEIYTFYAPLASEYKISRIQGTIYLYEE